jgi:cytoskeletal protein RodZ
MPYINNSNRSQTPRRSRFAALRQRRVLIPAVLLLIVLVAGGGTVWLQARNDSTNSSNSPKTDNATISESKNQYAPVDESPAPSPSPSPSPSTPPTDGNDKGSTPPNPNATLLDPTGNFVSSYKVYQGAGGQNWESVCNTTPGASCTITFTQGTTVKTLPAKTIDGNGTAYWNWTPDSLQLTKGNWTITVKVSLGTQNKQIVDAKPLEVL